MLGKKGIVDSLLIIMLILFVFAVMSIIAIRLWDGFNDPIQSMDEDIIDNGTKQQIDDLGTYINWADKLFSFLLIVLIIGLLITSFTLPAENYWIFIAYFALLLLLTFFAMMLSNTWTVIANNPELIAGLASLSFTDFVMRTFPYIVFFSGLLSGIIFYIRSRQELGSVGIGGGEEF